MAVETSPLHHWASFEPHLQHALRASWLFAAGPMHTAHPPSSQSFQPHFSWHLLQLFWYTPPLLSLLSVEAVRDTVRVLYFLPFSLLCVCSVCRAVFGVLSPLHFSKSTKHNTRTYLVSVQLHPCNRCNQPPSTAVQQHTCNFTRPAQLKASLQWSGPTNETAVQLLLLTMHYPHRQQQHRPILTVQTSKRHAAQANALL